MLSKKMTVSLMSLITIFALAFAVPSAMAGEFGVSLDMTGDISTAGGLQLSHPGTDELMVTVQFAQAVVLANTNISIDGYDMDGDYIAGVELAKKAPITPTTAARMIMLKIAVTAETAKVTLKIAKGIASASFANEDTSAELKDDIHLVADDEGAPTVYSVERADASLLPVKSSTVDVVITLSEPPKEFKKDHVDVSNATWGDPVAVESIPEQTPLSVSRPRSVFTGSIPLRRGLYDQTERKDDGTEVANTDDASVAEGIHTALRGDPPMALQVALDAYNAVATTDIQMDSILPETPVTAYTIGLHPPLETYNIGENNAVTYPTVAASTDAITITQQIKTADVLPFMRKVAPKLPDAPTGAQLATYAALRSTYNLYQAEVALHKAYMAAVSEEQKTDDTAVGEAIELDLGVPLQTATGRTSMLYRYVLTITPKYENKNDIVVKVKEWEDQKYPTADKYRPADMIGMAGYDGSGYKEGVNKLTIKVGREDLKVKALGVKFALPKDKVIPAGGYLVVAEEKAGSSIHVPPGAIDASPKTNERNEKERLYNVIDDGDLPNLFAHLSNGGIIDVMSPHGLVITEIMWGNDNSFDDPGKSQWLELYNAGAEYKTQDGDNTTYLIFYDGTDTLPAASTVKDRVGTTDAVGLTWALAGKGQSGRTAEKVAGEAAIAPTMALISMYRVMTAGVVADGRMADSWMQSKAPSTNFESNRLGIHIGTPGAATVMSVAEMRAAEAAAKAKAAAATAAAAAATAKTEGTGTVPQNGRVYISEIMVDRGNNLPQWIEIANGSRTEEVNLSGWTLTVNNASADTDVSVGSAITFTIPAGTKIGMFGQNSEPSTVLVVTEAGRTNLAGPAAKGQVLNLWESNQDELILGGVSTRRYSLLSEEAFLITLAPPAPTKTVVAATATVSEKAAAKAADARSMLTHKAASDSVGNLGADGAAAWALPMNMEGGRSSIIRRHIEITRGPAEPEDGAMMASWVLASETSFAQATHIRAASYYGAANDVGTPGFRAGGALPVELSHFRPARDDAGAVVITWSTQSELNNAGFFIKRSQQRDGQFQVINATMVAGAGTTSEKQFYTYTDSTAQPNVVYYYQIEDVSLDGNRQTLTHGTRLRGHIGAAGKLTSTWGELKTSNE